MPNANGRKLVVIYGNTSIRSRGRKGVIVSPTSPSPCCLRNMEYVGKKRVDPLTGYRFILKRCTTCGYTVRYFPRPNGTGGARAIRMRHLVVIPRSEFGRRALPSSKKRRR